MRKLLQLLSVHSQGERTSDFPASVLLGYYSDSLTKLLKSLLHLMVLAMVTSSFLHFAGRGTDNLQTFHNPPMAHQLENPVLETLQWLGFQPTRIGVGPLGSGVIKAEPEGHLSWVLCQEGVHDRLSESKLFPEEVPADSYPMFVLLQRLPFKHISENPSSGENLEVMSCDIT